MACLAALAGVALEEGQVARAARLSGTVEAALEALGVTALFPDDQIAYEQCAAALRQAPNPEVLQQAWAEGRTRPLAMVAGEELAESAKADGHSLIASADDATTHIAPAGGLSPREVEVLRLLAAGKSNKEIADALVISVNTVFRHITHIFEKTSTANRTEAASYAHRHGLVRQE